MAYAVATTPVEAPVIGIEVVPSDLFGARARRRLIAQTVGVAEAARILGVSVQAVRRRVTSGTLAGYRKGGDWRIPRTALER